jgi:hypothetical protein
LFLRERFESTNEIFFSFSIFLGLKTYKSKRRRKRKTWDSSHGSLKKRGTHQVES